MSKTGSPTTIIRQYRVLTKIGEGGMGEVYLAQDTKLGRKVALKVLPRDVISNPERLHRFERECVLSPESARACLLISAELIDIESGWQAELEEVGLRRYVPQTAVAAVHASRRGLNEALSSLEKACEERCVWLPYALTADPRFDGLRDEARFQRLVRRVAAGTIQR